MNKQIHEEVLRIEARGLQNIEMLALVTDSSYEVIFYATYNGRICQSNDLAEDGTLSLEFVDDIYASVAEVVRSDKKFDSSKMNIIKVSDKDVTVEYDNKNCRVYGLKKKWKESLGILQK